MNMRALFVVASLLVSACNMPETHGSSGTTGSGGSSTTGGGGEGGGGGQYDAGADAPPPLMCPPSPSECSTVKEVGGSCILSPLPAGTACVINGRQDKCNGYGHCGVIGCDTAADCGPSAPCFDVTCPADGLAVNVCASVPIDTGECAAPCGVAVAGPELEACGGVGIPYHCERKGGPAAGPCLAPASGAPFTFCCEY